jgi:glucose dehydrogenase
VTERLEEEQRNEWWVERGALVVIASVVGVAAAVSAGYWELAALAAVGVIVGLWMSYDHLERRTPAMKARWLAAYLTLLGLALGVGLLAGDNDFVLYAALIAAAFGGPLLAELVAPENVPRGGVA